MGPSLGSRHLPSLNEKPGQHHPHPRRRRLPSAGTTQTWGLGKGRGAKGQNEQELVVPTRLLADLTCSCLQPMSGSKLSWGSHKLQASPLPQGVYDTNQASGKAQVPVPSDAQAWGTPHGPHWIPLKALNAEQARQSKVESPARATYPDPSSQGRRTRGEGTPHGSGRRCLINASLYYSRKVDSQL